MRKHSKLAQELLARVRAESMLRPGERVGVAVSGGADSVALLRLLLVPVFVVLFPSKA